MMLDMVFFPLKLGRPRLRGLVRVEPSAQWEGKDVKRAGLHRQSECGIEVHVAWCAKMILV